MTPEKRAALEKAGFRVGDAADFLGLSEDEIDAEDARKALADVAENGTIPWDQVKADLGLNDEAGDDSSSN